MEAEASDRFFAAMDSARMVVEEEEKDEVEEEEEVDLGFLQWGRDRRRRAVEAEEEKVEPWPRRTREVMLEGYVEGATAGGDDGEPDGVARTKSLTDEDLEELKGCLDLGFGFSYEEIPELCSTLPALELCYSMNQRFLDEQQHLQQHSEDGMSSSSSSSSSSSGESTDNLLPPIANWKISSPGDNPDDVKARLKYWAQAVACTVKLCR